MSESSKRSRSEDKHEESCQESHETFRGIGSSSPSKRPRTIPSQAGVPSTPSRDPKDSRLDKKAANPSVQDTPLAIRYSQDIAYSQGTLEQKRDALLYGLPEEVPELPFDQFIDHLLPKCDTSDESFKEICARITAQRLFDVEKKKWPLLGSSGRELEDFKLFYRIQQSIVDIASVYLPNKQPLVTFASDGNQVPKCDWELPNKTRPDGAVSLRNSKRPGSKWHWADMICPYEFKIRDSDAAKFDDVGKVLWSLHFILGHDISRRFVFGLTVEKNCARLYFACRSNIIVSEEFDVVEGWESIVRITLSFGFATEEQLGWDSTYGIMIEDGKTKNAVRVGDCTYKIIKIINDVRAFSIIGRATRIYEVEEPISGRRVIIKDVWVDESRDREHFIQARIKDDLERNGFGELLRHFFTHERSSDVCTSDDIVDSTSRTMTGATGNELIVTSETQRFRIIPLRTNLTKAFATGYIKSHSRVAPTQDGVQKASVDIKATRQALVPRPFKIMPRTHYRLVIKERATPLQEILDLTTCLRLLKQLCKVVSHLGWSDWVHRDLSISNVYIYEGCLKVGDWEYSKNSNDVSAHHDVRTGTRWFWSIEVEAGKYIWAPRRPIFSERLQKALASVNKSRVPVAGKAILVHNPLHDYESIWWMLLMVFTMRRPRKPSSTWDMTAQTILLDGAFPSTLSSMERRFTFTHDESLGDLLDKLDPQLWAFAIPITDMAETLRKAFGLAELNLPEIDRSVWGRSSSLLETMERGFDELLGETWPEMITWGERVWETD